MNTVKKQRKLNYLLIVITGLLLAVTITTAVVLLRKPSHHDFPEGTDTLPNNSSQPAEAGQQSINPEEPPSSSTNSPSSTSTESNQGPRQTSETNNDSQSNNNQQVCSNPRVRKSWTELTNQERSRFINAIIQMKGRPAQSTSAANRYDEFAVIHDVYKSVAHNISAFLPWHRHFINEFENELQSIDSSVTLPYWDWARDAGNPAASAVFANDAFGGDGDPQTGCLTSGAFANWQVSYPAPHCLQRQFNGGRSVIQRWSSPEQVASLVFRFNDYSQFRMAFESTPHAAVHNGLGGDMRQTYSPNDPLFWVHHANVDRYFLAWQTEHPRSPYNGGSLNDIMAPFNVPVGRAFELPTNSRYCYTYSMSPESLRGSLRKRQSVEKREELQCPAHIPDEYTIQMGCSVEHVRMTEEYICDFTRRLNQKKRLSTSLKLSISDNSNIPINSTIWRYNSGKERELIIDSL